MGLTARLSPLVFAEFYKLLDGADRLSDDLEDRLSLIGLDHEWLAEAAEKYEAKWVAIRDAYPAEDDLHALTADHALLASWLTAPLLYREPSTNFDADLKSTVTQRAFTELSGALTKLPSAFKPTVSGWQLGMVVGNIDPDVPIALGHRPRDRNVCAAYDGLVDHVLHLQAENPPWPEMLGTSTLWRGTGLAEGIRPDAKDAQEAVKDLLFQSNRTLPDYLATKLAKHFSPITEQRNALSHVAALPGKPQFHELTGIADDWEKVRLTVFGITHFICSLAASELNEESAGVVHDNFWRVLTYDLDVWE